MTARKANNQRAKIDDVAKLAGVSTATVSRVINSTGTVSDRTAQRVLEAITDLKFVAHGSARSLAGSKTNTIGLVLPGVTTFFLTKLIQGISKSIYERGYSLLMYGDPRPASMASGNPLPLGEHNTDGLIVFTDFLDDYSIQYFHDRNLPIVMLHRSPPPGLKIPKVKFDNEEGAYQAVKHLLFEGYTKIVYLRGPNGNEDSEEREAGYRRALDQAGIAIDDALIGMGQFTAQIAKDVIAKMVDDNLPFDAIFAGDDNSAWGAIEALQEKGIAIPNDVAVAGFNDDSMSQYITPTMTTVRAPIHQSGYDAAEKLFALIEGKDVEMESLQPTELIIRDSTVRRPNG